ncbi:MAG: Panacea domain-containing protein [Acidimicrobiales bacterium]
MTGVSAHDVARELRARIPDVGVAKLQKLLYYVQGWHLTWAGEPMFGESIEAWTDGPVVAAHWADEKHDRPHAAAMEMDADEIATVDYVVQRYGRFSGKDLIRRTHQEDPWRDASEREEPAASGRNPEITHEALRRWFMQDDEYRVHREQVERLRQRADIYSFAPTTPSTRVDAAIARALSGERIRDTRPV